MQHPDAQHISNHPENAGSMTLEFAETSQGIVAFTKETGHVLGIRYVTNSLKPAGRPSRRSSRGSQCSAAF